jgi:hypothetical protein
MLEKQDDTDYLCGDGCCVDLNGHVRDFTSRADRSATSGRLGRQRNEGVVGRLLARPRGSGALPSLLVRRPGPRALHVIFTLRSATPASQIGRRPVSICERPAIGGLGRLPDPS